MFFRVALLFVVSALLGAPVAGAMTLKIATVAPEGTTWMNEMRAGAEEVSRRTDGRVKFKFYPGGVMGNDKSVMRKMRIGQLQGGALTSGELAEIYPDIQLYSIPFLFESYEEVDYVRERMDGLLKEGLEKQGFVALGLSEGGFVYLMCKRPLRRLSDLKFQKVWMPEGDTLAKIVFDIIGVSPVSLQIADVYTGLQTGLVDTVGTPPMAAIAFQWHTKLTHFSDEPLMYLTGLLVVDQKAFHKLSPGDQIVVREVMGDVFKRLDKSNRADNGEAREALLRQGMELVTLSEDESRLWHEVGEKATRRLRTDKTISDDLYEILVKHLETFHGEPAAK